MRKTTSAGSRKRLPAILLVLLAALTAGFATAQGDAERVLRVRWYEDMDNLDPVRLQDSLGTELAYKIYDNLVRVEPGSGGVIVPDLAESWEISEDGLTYTFHLRQGVQWQRGYGEVTAHDVRFSLLRHKADDVGSIYRAEADPIVDVEVVDDYTVRVNMSRPYPGFLQEFASYRPGFIVNERALAEIGDAYLDRPVGSGPYELVQWNPLDRVVLELHDAYDGPEVYFDRVEYIIIPDDNVFEIALQNGEVDIGYLFDTQVQQRVEASESYSSISTPGSRVIYISANLEVPALDDVRVRQALWYAIDRDLIVETILQGQGGLADTVLNPAVFGYYGERGYTYDPDRARELLAEAGASDLSFEMLIQSNYQIPAMAQAIQAMWREVGVNVELVQREFAQIVELRRSGNFHLVMGALARSGPDQYVTPFYDSAAIPYPNSSRYANPEVDALINAARVELDTERRAEIYQEIQRLVAADAPTIPIVNPVFMLAFRSDLQGVKIDLLTVNVSELSLAE